MSLQYRNHFFIARFADKAIMFLIFSCLFVFFDFFLSDALGFATAPFTASRVFGTNRSDEAFGDDSLLSV